MSEVFKAIQSRFPVNWLTLLIGWRGVGHRPRQVDVHDVEDLAAESLGLSEHVDARVADLAVITEAEEERVESILAKLAEEEAYQYDDELRKWMIVLLEEELASLPSDPLYALLRLTDFWGQFGFPADSPHEVQGRDNTMTPPEYYTRETYDRLLRQHKSWLESETARLSASEGRS